MAQPPFFKQDILPNFQAIQPSQIKPTIEALLKKNQEKIEALLSHPEVATWNNLMQPIEDMSDELSKIWSPVGHLHAVMQSEELRKAYNETLPLLTEYHTTLAQNEKLYQAVLFIKNSPEFATLTSGQQKIIDNDLRDFKLAGVHLLPEQKAHMKELQKKLSQLMTTFSENVLDATQGWHLHVTDEKQVAGLPKQALQLAIDNAKKRNVTGYVFTLDYPSYSTATLFLQNRELRKQLYTAYCTRASNQGPTANQWDNTKIMEAIVNARHEIAQLVGFNNFAEYSLATKMAKDPHEVTQFLNNLVTRSKPIAEEEYKEIQAFAQKTDGITDLAAWDIAYYSEKIQQSKFQFSQEDFRPYFPIEKVLTGLFSIVNKLYGITVRTEDNIAVWHPDAHFFSVYDEHNHLRGGFYIDLYARTHKRDGAWMDECLSRRLLKDHEHQPPVAYLTCNFMPPINDQPALLTHDDVLTLFHEFGHCLHHMLTKMNYPSVAGINGVPWDAVEFPSQFMENFCWEKESLALIAAHYQTGASLPDDLYDKMIAAKNFHSGLQMIRQLEFSLFDFNLHWHYDPTQSSQVQKNLDDVRKEVSVIPAPAFNRFQNSFSHIFAGGYAAGYYSYKWAEVLSADAYAAFQENGIFDRATGRSFMENILEIGGVRDPMTSFVAFRGRKPTIDALLQQNGMIQKNS